MERVKNTCIALGIERWSTVGQLSAPGYARSDFGEATVGQLSELATRSDFSEVADGPYFAVSMNRDSRSTVTLISPG